MGTQPPAELPLGIIRDQWGYIRCGLCGRCEFRDGVPTTDGYRRTERGLSVVNLISQIQQLEETLRMVEREMTFFSPRWLRHFIRRTLTTIGMSRARDHGDGPRFNAALGKWAGDPSYYDLDLYARKPFVMEETLI